MSNRVTVTLPVPSFRFVFSLSAFVFAASLGMGVARAALPDDDDVLVYSGVLEEGGAPVDGTRQVNVQMFATQLGGDPLCESGDQEATLVRGRFRVGLPAACADAVRTSASGDVFINVAVDGASVGSRTRAAGVPFALVSDRANVATIADSATSADTANTALAADTSLTAETANDLDCEGCVSSPQLAPGAVGASQIASNVIDRSHLDIAASFQMLTYTASFTFDPVTGAPILGLKNADFVTSVQADPNGVRIGLNSALIGANAGCTVTPLLARATASFHALALNEAIVRVSRLDGSDVDAPFIMTCTAML